MKYLALIVLFLTHSAFASSSWENYLEFPSPKNAALVISPPTSEQVDEGLGILEIQVVSGDLEAIKLALRLKEWFKLSAATSEGISVIVGRSVRAFPEKFLLANSTSANTDLCTGVSSYGFEYVDRIAAQLYENKQRRDAISNVDNRTLLNLQKVCLSILNSDYQSLEMHISS